MNLYNGADASQPGNPLPAGTRILAAYVGIPGQGNRSPDTPHIWSASEWNEYYEADPTLVMLPIYVHNYDDGHPTADADNAVDAILSLGWAPNMPELQRRVLAIDCETLVDNEYFYEMSQQVYYRGFSPVLYGSSMVTQNQVYGMRGYWVASLTARKPTVISAAWVGQQWRFGTDWDSDVFSQELYDGCGRGLRK